jgi:hypothetical protein
MGVEVKADGAWEVFDQVVMATHSDDSLALLADPSPDEVANLGAIAYQPNDIVLHADEPLPDRRIAMRIHSVCVERVSLSKAQHFTAFLTLKLAHQVLEPFLGGTLLRRSSRVAWFTTRSTKKTSPLIATGPTTLVCP